MRFILDASVTICWAMRDENHPAAERAFLELGAGSALVPGIWWFEIRNILLMGERRQRITPSDSFRFLHDLGQLPIQIGHGSDSSLVMDLARRLQLTVYDAAYLALAIEENLPLATLDRALQSAAVAAGVKLLA